MQIKFIDQMKTDKNCIAVNLPYITIDDLCNNELWWPTSILAAHILKDERKRKAADKYVLDVFNVLLRIHECFSTLYRAKGFILRRPSVKQLESNNQMTIIDYYYYHYDVVVHKLSTIRELSYKLINVVFELGIEDKNCCWKTILKGNDKIAMPGIMNIQQLYYKLLKKVEDERNESTHSGRIELTFLKEIDLYVSVSQMIKQHKIPMDGWDPMAKGSYHEHLLYKAKRELIKHVEHYCNISISFIHIPTCCLGRVFLKNLSKDLQNEFKLDLERAKNLVDNYKNRNNKFEYMIDWLMHLDDSAKKYAALELDLKVKKKTFTYF